MKQWICLPCSREEMFAHAAKKSFKCKFTRSCLPLHLWERCHSFFTLNTTSIASQHSIPRNLVPPLSERCIFCRPNQLKFQTKSAQFPDQIKHKLQTNSSTNSRQIQAQIVDQISTNSRPIQAQIADENEDEKTKRGRRKRRGGEQGRRAAWL